MTEPRLFADAEIRYRRAQEHLKDVEAIITAIEAERHFAIADPDPLTGQERLKLPEAATPERDLRVRIGEFAYNLRATLDYIVYVLSGGKDTAQFPLEDDPEIFKARITGKIGNRSYRPYLRGVDQGDCELIARYQPYNGAEWAKLLRGVSNRDKHRELVVLDAISRSVLFKSIGLVYPDTLIYPDTMINPFGYDAVHVENPVEIALPEGQPVREALQELEAKVGEVLSLFQQRNHVG